jgi:hypothetical protein
MGSEQSRQYRSGNRTQSCFKIGKQNHYESDDDSSIDSYEQGCYYTYNKSYRNEMWDSPKQQKTTGEKFDEFWKNLFKINKRKKHDESIFFPYDEI